MNTKSKTKNGKAPSNGKSLSIPIQRVEKKEMSKESAEESVKQMLVLLNEHEPEVQNNIIETLIVQVAKERKKEYDLTGQAHKRAAGNMDSFASGKTMAQDVIKNN